MAMAFSGDILKTGIKPEWESCKGSRADRCRVSAMKVGTGIFFAYYWYLVVYPLSIRKDSVMNRGRIVEEREHLRITFGSLRPRQPELPHH